MVVVRRALRPGELQADVRLRPWYLLDVISFVRVYRNKRWFYGRIKAAIIAFYSARVEV